MSIIQCAVCGIEVHTISSSRKYCTECSEEVIKEKRRARDLTPEAKAKAKASKSTPEYKAKAKAKRDTPEAKARVKARQSTPETKSRKNARQRTPEYKAKQRRIDRERQQAKELDLILSIAHNKQGILNELGRTV